MFEEIEIKNWRHLQDCVRSLNLVENKWVFRGQSNHLWSLSSTLERARLQFDEEKIIEDFKRNAHLYIDDSKLDTNLAWLSVMQHHGCPTRLLDWTESPYVAIFFALNKVNVEEDYAALFAFNTDVIISDIKRKFKGTHKYAFLSQMPYLSEFRLAATEFDQIFFTDWDADPFEEMLTYVLPVMPYYGHTRLTIQQGLFLLPTNVHQPFETNLEKVFTGQEEEVVKKRYKKFLIPAKLKPEIIYELNSNNINDSTLFPGIDGYSKYLEKKYALPTERILVRDLENRPPENNRAEELEKKNLRHPYTRKNGARNEGKTIEINN